MSGQAGKVVIAGGSGFIGRHLVPALAAAGHEVVVLGRGAGAAPSGARFVPWQPGHDGAWQQELDGASALVNLCGAGIGDARWTASRKRTLVDSRTLPSQALTAACRRVAHPPEVLLQASGVGYYGTGEQAVDEDAGPGADFLAQLAEAWESPLADPDLAAAGVRGVRLRFGVVLGRDGGALPRMLLPFRLFAGGPLADGRQWLSWIHVRDVVQAIRFVMTAEAETARVMDGVVNVTAPHPVRNREFAATAAAALHRPALLRMPRALLQALLGEQATLVCDGQQALPARLQRAGFRFEFPTIADALSDLTR
jgi:uncharacterized protein